MNKSQIQATLTSRFIQPQFVHLFPCRQVVGCNFLHPNTSCTNQMFKKMFQMIKVNSKLYLLIHLIPFVIFKIRKIKNKQLNASHQIFVTFKKFVYSILCMVINIGAVKSVLCVNSNSFNITNAGIGLPIPFALSSLGIILETGSRRQQMVYFALVRALRSFYLYIKRRMKFQLAKQQHIAFILMFGILSFLFYQQPKLIKNNTLLGNIWGDNDKPGSGIQLSQQRKMEKNTEALIINTGLEAIPQTELLDQFAESM